MLNLSEINVAILAGGFGTRFKSITNGKHKVLTEVKKHPFLELLLHQLNQAGFKKIIICTGYLGNQIRKKFGASYKNLQLFYSQEKKPLGTAGSLRNAFPLLNSETVMVMNGDSFCEINFKGFWKFHIKRKSNATIAVTTVSDVSHSGKVKLGKDKSIINFQEKQEGSGGGLINAGIYLINRALIAEIPVGKKVSIEKDIFPNWIGREFYGYMAGESFIDIGTPENYARAEQFFSDHPLAKKRFILLDRDGTIIVEKNYLSDHNKVELIENASGGLKKLKELGFGLLVITNQAGIGRGYFSLKDLTLIHKKMVGLLKKEGVKLDGIYFCPHKPDDNCSCRKPKLGLVKKAAKEHNFDPKECFIIGDKELDIELGQKMKANTFLVRTGYGSKVEKESLVEPDYIVDDLEIAFQIIQRDLL